MSKQVLGEIEGGFAVIRESILKLHAYLLGKTMSLRLNAYEDAAIAGEILRYVKTRQMPDGPEPVCQRAASLIRQTPEDDLKDHRLVMQAYCQYRLNGRGDIMQARAIERLFGLEIVVWAAIYAPYESGPIDLLFWVGPVFRRDVTCVLTYARDMAGVDLRLSCDEMAAEVIRVQEANIAANQLTHDLLLGGMATDHPKVNRLRQVAETMIYPKIFLSSATRTQVEMSRRDRLGAWLLRLRMKSLHGQ
jgi:hypothetical protein